MLSLTAKLLIVATTGTAGYAGWVTTQTVAEPASALPTSTQTGVTDSVPVDSAQAAWGVRRSRIRAVLPSGSEAPPAPEPAPGEQHSRVRQDFHELMSACTEDLESESSGIVALQLREIGAPDLGTIYESVQVLHSVSNDSAVVECLQQSIYSFVGEAPGEPFERTTIRTLRLNSGASVSGVLKVRLAKAIVAGSLDRDIIRRIVVSRREDVRACYFAGLLEDPDLEGRVIIGFEINADGRVTESETESSELENEDVDNCIASAVGAWRFPRSSDSNPVQVSFPFVLSTS